MKVYVVFDECCETVNCVYLTQQGAIDYIKLKENLDEDFDLVWEEFEVLE